MANAERFPKVPVSQFFEAVRIKDGIVSVDKNRLMRILGEERPKSKAMERRIADIERRLLQQKVGEENTMGTSASGERAKGQKRPATIAETKSSSTDDTEPAGPVKSKAESAKTQQKAKAESGAGSKKKKLKQES